MTRIGDGNRGRLPIVVFLVLLLILGVQLSVALHRTLTGDRPGAFSALYAVGDTVRFLEAVESNGKQVWVSLAGGDGTATVVYAFHTECVHCRAVAPAWTQHFANSGSASGHVRRVAVTEEDPATAGQYATRFRWHHVDVLSLADLPSKRHRACTLRIGRHASQPPLEWTAGTGRRWASRRPRSNPVVRSRPSRRGPPTGQSRCANVPGAGTAVGRLSNRRRRSP